MRDIEIRDPSRGTVIVVVSISRVPGYLEKATSRELRPHQLSAASTRNIVPPDLGLAAVA
eukprot:COSAG06_NODE_6042_length_3138_cov_36.552155_2_plen_60_part_00